MPVASDVGFRVLDQFLEERNFLAHAPKTRRQPISTNFETRPHVSFHTPLVVHHTGRHGMGCNYGLAATLIAGLVISPLSAPAASPAGEESLLTSRLVMQVDAGQDQMKRVVLENGDPVFHGDRLSLELTAHADLIVANVSGHAQSADCRSSAPVRQI